jgi:hypothetical protein
MSVNRASKWPASSNLIAWDLEQPRPGFAGPTCGEKAPYSAGLAAGGAPVLDDEAFEAAAFFSTIFTAMIEPS